MSYTVLLPDKETHQAEAGSSRRLQVAPRSARELHGYEIHMGKTILGRTAHPFAQIVSRSGGDVEVLDGAVSRDGRVFGTYLHGLFDNDSFRSAFLNRIRRAKGLARAGRASRTIRSTCWPRIWRQHLDMERLLTICGLYQSIESGSIPSSFSLPCSSTCSSAIRAGSPTRW